MRTPEVIPGADERQLLVSQIGKLASKTATPDPELYAMMYVSVHGKLPAEHWRHVRNMAAVQIELVTNTADVGNQEHLVIRAIRSMLVPQINRLRAFKEGWYYSSPAFRAALEDVSQLQQGHYKHDRPSKKFLKDYENNRH